MNAHPHPAAAPASTQAAVEALRTARAEADTLRQQRNTLGTLLLLVLLAVTVLLLTGCGGGGDDGPDQQQRPPNCALQPIECR